MSALASLGRGQGPLEGQSNDHCDEHDGDHDDDHDGDHGDDHYDDHDGDHDDGDGAECIIMDHRPRVDWLWKSYRRILKKLSKERRYFVMIIDYCGKGKLSWPEP